MSLHVEPVEWIWLASSLGGLVFTLVALRGAWGRRGITNGARSLIARGNVRREAFRSIVQSLLLVVIIPSLFSDRPITLSLPVAALIAVPVVLLTATALDRREQRTLSRIVSRQLRKDGLG